MTLLSVNGLAWRPTPDDDLLLRGVDLVVEAGDTIAIHGPSGSGKSTILRCIVAFEEFERGSVEHRGAPVDPSTILEFRRDVVYLQQRPAAVGKVVADNLQFARDMAGASDDVQRQLLDRFGLSELPDDREFDRLSVGEQQRLCFVRAMTLQPTVLLLDEPTSALDDANVTALESIVDDWLAEDAQRAAIWVTHDAEQSERVAARSLRLRDGTLV